MGPSEEIRSTDPVPSQGHVPLKYAVRPGRFVGTLQGGRAPGRNLPCPCGSGRKFKRCCLKESER